MVINGVDYGDLTDFGGDSGGNWDYDYSNAGVGVGSESLNTASPLWWQTALQTLGIGAGNEGGLLGGISGNTAGIGAQGILSLIGVLNAKPQTGTKQTSETRGGTTTTVVGSPEWYKQLTENLGTAISGEGKSWSDLQEYMKGGMEKVGDADLSGYMNQYTGAVLQPQLDRMTDDYLRSENARRAKAGQIGAFGGSRDILEGSLATERLDKAKNEATANAFSNAFTNAQTAFGTDRAAQQWGTHATGNLFGLLKPNTTTNVAATAGDTLTTVATGSEPNTFGQLGNWAADLYNMANPLQVGTGAPVVR